MVLKTKRIILQRFVLQSTSTRCEAYFSVSSSVCSAARSRSRADRLALFKARRCVHQTQLLQSTVLLHRLRRISPAGVVLRLGYMDDELPTTPSETPADFTTNHSQDVSQSFSCRHSTERALTIPSFSVDGKRGAHSTTFQLIRPRNRYRFGFSCPSHRTLNSDDD